MEDFYEQIKKKWGTWKNFIDHTSPRVTGRLDLSVIDPEMHNIITLLNDNKLYTISCCSGHGERSACIVFDTTVTIEQIVKVLNHNETFTIVNETVYPLFNEDCVYYRIHFDFKRLKETFMPLYDVM